MLPTTDPLGLEMHAVSYWSAMSSETGLSRKLEGQVMPEGPPSPVLVTNVTRS
jgi:hypothetical protein